jgi:hypothetical protein
LAKPYAFDWTAWKTVFPEFTAVPEALANFYFSMACQYWRNDGSSPNPDSSQGLYLNLLTSHVAALNAQAQGSANRGTTQDPNNPVGRISSATQGSVTVQTDLGMAPTLGITTANLVQTRYGMLFASMVRGYELGGVYSVGSGPAAPAGIPFNEWGI